MSIILRDATNSTYQAAVNSSGQLSVTGTFAPSGTQDVNITEVSGSAVVLGQAVMASSIPVVIASNQSAIPVSGSVTVSGTVAATQSGSWTVTANQGTSPWITQDKATSATGSAVSADAIQVGGTDHSGDLLALGVYSANFGPSFFPAPATFHGIIPLMSDGTNMYPFFSPDGQNLGVNVVSGTVTATITGVVSVDGTVTNDSTAVSFLNYIPSLVAVATSAAPSYTNTFGAALSVDLSGNLRTSVNNTVTVSGTVAATQSGTWTVQPGNTANTTPWLMTISQGGNSANVSSENALQVVEQGASHIAYNQVSVGTSATQIVGSRTTRRSVKITNLGSTAVYIGDSSVTTSTGDLLVGTAGAFISIPANVAIYGIVGTGTQSVSYIEVYD